MNSPDHMTLDPDSIGFRKLQVSDIDLVWRWRQTGFVKQWYSKHDTSYEAFVEKLVPRIEGRTPTTCYLIMYGDRPIGYIHTFRIKDYPEYAEGLQLAEDAASLDVFIGESDYIHRGLGSHILRKFLSEIVFGLSDVVSCVFGPEIDNVVAIRAYQKAGLKHLKTVRLPGDDEPTYLMRISRAEALAE
jgi:RimJ/RimL family protein N-acetyltransferase